MDYGMECNMGQVGPTAFALTPCKHKVTDSQQHNQRLPAVFYQIIIFSPINYTRINKSLSQKNVFFALPIAELYVILQDKSVIMNKILFAALAVLLLFSSCANEFNKVYMTSNVPYKYEYAKECFANGKWTRATTLLTDMITVLKGTDNGQESLYMLAMAQYNNKDYEGAARTFKSYFTAYPKGFYAEMAEFYVGQSLYESTPEPRLDQSATVSAISAFQEFLDLYPDAKLKPVAQQRLFALQDKLVRKELFNAQLYYDLGPYFGNCNNGENNYEACIITAQNALKEYPYSKLREEFSILLMKSKYELAQQSVDNKKMERYQDAEDECYGFINEFPDSKERATAERYISKCKDYISAHSNESAIPTFERN